MKRFQKRCRITGHWWHHPTRCTLWWVKRKVYEVGKRPSPKSLLFSPSLDLVYGWEDARKREAR